MLNGVGPHSQQPHFDGSMSTTLSPVPDYSHLITRAQREIEGAETGESMQNGALDESMQTMLQNAKADIDNAIMDLDRRPNQIQGGPPPWQQQQQQQQQQQ